MKTKIILLALATIFTSSCGHRKCTILDGTICKSCDRDLPVWRKSYCPSCPHYLDDHLASL